MSILEDSRNQVAIINYYKGRRSSRTLYEIEIKRKDTLYLHYNIRFVVLNRLPKDDEPAIPWQRGGRVGRDGGSSEMIILLEHWVKGPRKTSSASQGSQQRNAQQRARRPSPIMLESASTR